MSELIKPQYHQSKETLATLVSAFVTCPFPEENMCSLAIQNRPNTGLIYCQTCFVKEEEPNTINQTNL